MCPGRLVRQALDRLHDHLRDGEGIIDFQEREFAGMAHSLRELALPMAEDEFTSRYRGGELFVVPAPHPEKLAGLLPWSTINSLLEGDGLQPDRMAVMRDGVRLPDWIWYRDQPGLRLNAASLLNLLRQGATILVDRIDELVPGIRRLVGAVQEHLQARVSANAYLSFRQGSALAPHYDNHDIIVAQIHGNKRWWFYDRREAFPVAIDPTNWGKRQPPGNPVREVVLTAGDVMVVPRGEWHHTAVEGDVSVHLTVGVRPARGLHLIQRCLDEASADVLFRQDIPHYLGPAALAAHEALLKQRLCEIIARVSLHELVAEAAAPQPSAPAPVGPSGSTGRFQLPLLDGLS